MKINIGLNPRFGKGCMCGNNVTIGNNVQIGYGVIIADNVIVGNDVKIGHYVTIDDGCQIGNKSNIGIRTSIKRKVSIGNNSSIDYMVSIAGKAVIGNKVKIYQLSNIANGSRIEDRVFIGPGVIFTNTRRISHGRGYPVIKKAPIIRWGVRIGAAVTILPEVEIGEECLIGAGSVVTKSTNPRWVYWGNPAKPIRQVPEEELY